MDSHQRLSQWSDHFPAGLRVLVVDNDPTHSKMLQNMLETCNYQVTMSNTMRAALDLLRETEKGFDVVISDVNLPDMDGFKLLEHVALKMRIPVIMMSVDGETSRVMRGVQHGACDYLLKPIRMEELRNIWQHVVRKRILEGRERPLGVHVSSGDVVSTCGRKRKDVVGSAKSHDGESCGGDTPSSVKKARVVWSTELHHKFVKAVNQIGVEKAGPKKILDLMGVPWLTRENIASHLQKYRLYLRRQQQENELKAAALRRQQQENELKAAAQDGMKVSRISSVDPASSRSVCLQSSISQTSVTVQHNVVTNGIYEVPRHKVQIQREDAKGVVSMPLSSTHTNALFGDTAYLGSASRISFNRFIGPLDSESRNKPHFQFGHHFDNDHLTFPSTAEANMTPFCGIKNHNMTHDGVYDNLESSLKSLIFGTGGSALRVSGDDFNEYPTHGDLYPRSFGDVSQQEQIYDPLNFDCVHSDELLGCLEMNQGVHLS